MLGRIMAAAFVIFTVIGSFTAAYGNYTYTPLMDLPSTWDAYKSFASGINNAAQVVGVYYSDYGGEKSFLLSNSTYNTVGTNATRALGINNKGQIVGVYLNSSTNYIYRGFLLDGTTFKSLSHPGSFYTTPSSINDNGQIVGSCSDSGATRYYGFLYENGNYSLFSYPNAYNTEFTGINNKGQIVGVIYSDYSDYRSFLLSGSTYSMVHYPGATGTYAKGINNKGQIVGWYHMAGQISGFMLDGSTYTRIQYPNGGKTVALGINDNGQIVGYLDWYGFLATPTKERPTVLIDPLASGLIDADKTSILNNPDILATHGNVVQGVAADGVARLIVRIPTASAQDSVDISVMDDQMALSSSPDSDGFLLTLDNQGGNSSNALTLTPKTTSAGPMAFAIFVAPLNFSRGSQDNPLAERYVTLQVKINSDPPRLISVKIVRPPVILVHGLWGDPDNWKNFNLPNSFPSTSIYRVEYNIPVPGIETAISVPLYTASVLSKTRANSLGFNYNAPIVFQQIIGRIADFNRAHNVCASQADIVAHSMGGLVSRAMASLEYFQKDELMPGALDSLTYHKGPIHKLITIGTPHLGTPLAMQLLTDNNACIRDLLTINARFPEIVLGPPMTCLKGVSISGKWVSGAVNDLQGDGFIGGWQSPALSSLSHPFPIAYAAGIMDAHNLTPLNCSFCASSSIWHICRGSMLAANLTAEGWPHIFAHGSDSDAIVPLESQINGRNTTPSTPGVIHSNGTSSLGFATPSELDGSSGILERAIFLLNEPTNSTEFQ